MLDSTRETTKVEKLCTKKWPVSELFWTGSSPFVLTAYLQEGLCME